MTIGATSSFTESRDDLIAEALENCGAIEPGGTRDSTNSNLFEMGVRSLNRVAKAIDSAGGVKLWKYVRRTTTTTAGIDTFVTASDVFTVDGPGRYTRVGATSALQILPMARKDYMALADRTTPGPSTQYFCEQSLGATTMYLWPVPDATGDTIEYTACVRGADFTTGADTPDFFPEWLNCLVYGLTVELSPKLSQPGLVAIYKPMYEAELQGLINADNERLGMTLVPFGMRGSQGGAG